jgi:hypothetical protein
MTNRNKNKNRTPEFEVEHSKGDIPFSGPLEHINKNKILESTVKVVEPKAKRVKTISKMTFWCTACTQNYTIHGKDEDGKFLVPQQICPHMTIKDFEMLR